MEFPPHKTLVFPAINFHFWDHFISFFHDFPMIFPWFSHDFPWFSHGFSPRPTTKYRTDRLLWAVRTRPPPDLAPCRRDRQRIRPKVSWWSRARRRPGPWDVGGTDGKRVILWKTQGISWNNGGCYMLLYVVICCHMLLYVVICCYMLLYVVIMVYNG